MSGIKQIKFNISGVVPLLMSNIDSARHEKPTAKMTHEDWEHSEEKFRSRAYLNTNNQIELPRRLLLAMLVEASKRSGIRQAGKRSGYAKVIQSVVFFEPLILDQTAKDLERDEQFVCVNGKGRVLRVRPRLNNWSGEGTLVLADEGALPEDVLIELFDFAARFIGIGDYRPQYGRFEVEFGKAAGKKAA